MLCFCFYFCQFMYIFTLNNLFCCIQLKVLNALHLIRIICAVYFSCRLPSTTIKLNTQKCILIYIFIWSDTLATLNEFKSDLNKMSLQLQSNNVNLITCSYSIIIGTTIMHPMWMWARIKITTTMTAAMTATTIMMIIIIKLSYFLKIEISRSKGSVSKYSLVLLCY